MGAKPPRSRPRSPSASSYPATFGCPKPSGRCCEKNLRPRGPGTPGLRGTGGVGFRPPCRPVDGPPDQRPGPGPARAGQTPARTSNPGARCSPSPGTDRHQPGGCLRSLRRADAVKLSAGTQASPPDFNEKTTLARVPARGLPGRGGGRASYVEAAPEWRATTRQVCGLWPFIAGSGTPMVGVPIGRDLRSAATVCCDPISWFARAGLIANPSMFVLGKPGLGKSSLIRRMAIGLCGFGVQPLIFGDLKPDYVDLIGALGGNVVALGRGQGALNVLDPGAATAAALRLTGAARQKLTQDALGRRLTMVAALVGLNRRSRVTDADEAVIASALGVLDEHHRPGEATLRELIAVLEEGPEELRS